MNELKQRSLRGLLWTASESLGVAILSLGSFIIIARMLDPGDVGAVTLAGAVVICLNLVIAHGFSDALVQMPEVERTHYDTGFWATILAALTLSGACIASADTLAGWLNEPLISELLPWLSGVLIFNAIGIIPMAAFRRELQFRPVALCSLVGRAAGAIGGISMALDGFGPWSLVGQQLITVGSTNIGILLMARWVPRLRFSLAYAKRLGGFGAHVSASQIVSALGEQALNLLVGILFGSVVLGHFAVAWRLVQLLRSLISTAVYQVAFSAFARLQENRAAFIRAFEESTKVSCFIGFPIAAGMMLTAEPGMLTVLGHKWASSIPIFSILALELLPAFFTMFFTAAYRAANYPGWALTMAVVYLVTGLLAVAVAAPFGIVAVCAAWTGRCFLLLPIHLYLLKRLLGVPVGELLLSSVRPAAATGLMAILVEGVHWASENRLQNATQLGLFVVAGMASYAIAASAFATREMRAKVFGKAAALVGSRKRQDI